MDWLSILTSDHFKRERHRSILLVMLDFIIEHRNAFYDLSSTLDEQWLESIMGRIRTDDHDPQYHFCWMIDYIVVDKLSRQRRHELVRIFHEANEACSKYFSASGRCAYSDMVARVCALLENGGH